MSSNQTFRTIEQSLSGVLIGATILLSAYAHHAAGLTLPIPWDDEASFVWPAISFMESGTLQSDHLNASRPIMWMPPGYMVLMGTVFRVTGYSLETARWLSWLFSIGAYLAAVGLLWIQPLRPIAIGLCSALWLGGTFTAIGNVARMDGLTLALGLCGLLLTARRMPYLGLAILGLNLVVHPNGLYFAAVALGYGFAMYRMTWPRARMWDVVALCASGACLGLYAIHVLQNREAFLHDMGLQLGRKGERAPIHQLLAGANAWYVSALAMVALYCAVRRSPMLLYAGLTAACFLISRIGMEMWYDAFADYSFIMMSIGCLWAAWHLLKRTRINPRANYAVILALTAPLVVIHSRQGTLPGPRDWPEALTWGSGMRIATEVPYFTDEDRESVRQAVEEMLPNIDHTPARVSFFPRGEGLLFHGAWNGRAIVYAPHFAIMQADIHVVRESAYTPPWQEPRSQAYVSSVPLGSGPVIARNGTEIWYVYRNRY